VAVPARFPEDGTIGLALRKTKAGRPQSVAVQREAVALPLATLVLSRRRDPHVFPFSSAQFRKALAEASRALGLPVLKPHSCRHGGASQDLRDGHPLDWVQHRGRWASQGTARRYFQQVNSSALDLVQFVHQADLGRQMAAELPALLTARLRKYHRDGWQSRPH
jgi:integrase